MRAFADGSQTVERGHAKGGGKVAVRAATREVFPQRKSQLLRDLPRMRKKRGAGAAFQGRTRKSAAHANLGAPKDRPERFQLGFDPAHVRERLRAQVDRETRLGGNDVAARSSL